MVPRTNCLYVLLTMVAQEMHQITEMIFAINSYGILALQFENVHEA